MPAENPTVSDMKLYMVSDLRSGNGDLAFHVKDLLFPEPKSPFKIWCI
jgi:hypothetical protein